MRYDAEKARERNEIGRLITEARKAQGLTQGEVAEEDNSSTTVGRPLQR